MLRKFTIPCLLLTLMAPMLAVTTEPALAQPSTPVAESFDAGSAKAKPKKPKPKPGPREEGEDN